MENTDTISVNSFAKTSGKGKDIKETAVGNSNVDRSSSFWNNYCDLFN